MLSALGIGCIFVSLKNIYYGKSIYKRNVNILLNGQQTAPNSLQNI